MNLSFVENAEFLPKGTEYWKEKCYLKQEFNNRHIVAFYYPDTFRSHQREQREMHSATVSASVIHSR